MRSDDMRRLAIVVGLTLLLAGLTQAAGVFNRADGDYLSIDPDRHVSLNWASGWTIACWVKVNSLDGTSQETVFSSGDAKTSLYILFRESDYPADKWYFKLGSMNQSTRSVTAGDWMHLAIVGRTTDGTKYADCYVDGSAVAVSMGSTASITPTAISLGALPSGTYLLDGYIAEFAIWDTNLPSTDVATLQSDPPSAVGTPAVYVDLYDGIEDVGADALTITNNGSVTIDTGTHPDGMDHGDPAPSKVTMVWPAQAADANEVAHQTYAVWTKTPADTELEQRFSVYVGTDANSLSLMSDANEIADRYVHLDDLEPNTTYYLRVDANSTGGVTTGDVIEFRTEAVTSGTLYYVSPLGAGDETGNSEPNAMPWASVASETASGDTIRLIDPNEVIYYNYEGTYTEWPDRVYEANEVTEHHISRTFQDWRRIGRFIDGSYWVVGPAVIMAYDPPRQTMDSKTVNGMMVDPDTTNQGFDARGAAYPNNYDVAEDRGDELPLMLDTYPASVLNEYAIDNTSPVWQEGGWFGSRYGSVLTVVQTALANNIWFRPPYRPYTGRAVTYQWSDVVTSRIPQTDIPCTYTLRASSADEGKLTLGGITSGFQSLERIVSRPMFQVAIGWRNSRYCVPFEHSGAYAGDIGREQSVAYMALYSSALGSLTGDKRRLLIGCIQRGLDFAGVYLEGDNPAWFKGEGCVSNGAYWPILFAGIVLDDPDLYDMGIDTHQEKNDSWNYTPRMDFQECMQFVQLTNPFLDTGKPPWETPPWTINGIASIYDSTGTVSVTNGSTTVTGQVGDDWSGIVATDNSSTSETDERDWFIPATYADGVWTIADESQATDVDARPYIIVGVDAVSSPPTITLDRAYTGETDAATTFLIADELYCGQNFNISKDRDYREFSSSQLGDYVWYEMPASNLNVVSALYGQDSYETIAVNSSLGMVLAALVMQKEGGYPAVKKWNRPQVFEYYDWWLTTNGAPYTTYCNGWVGTQYEAEWTWPLSSGDSSGPVKSTRMNGWLNGWLNGGMQ